jgi:LmbE family N-acetylglucosaminyl deacetylase
MSTVVFLHAHPDDEALLTGGTMARLAAEGHRVVLVVATDGGAGLTASVLSADLADRRRGEVAAAAEALGVQRVVHLGYADSGSSAATRVAGGFADVDLEEAAAFLAGLLAEEGAAALTTYDSNGGYGHPDHVHVHRVGARAAELAGTPIVLEATVDRRSFGWVLAVLRPVARFLPGVDLGPVTQHYADPATLTHRVDVRPQLAAKRAALAAHASQATADSGFRTVGVLLALPGWAFRLACGHEWYVERGRAPGGHLLDDPLASLADVLSG